MAQAPPTRRRGALLACAAWLAGSGCSAQPPSPHGAPVSRASGPPAATQVVHAPAPSPTAAGAASTDAAAPVPAPACEPLDAAGFERPQHSGAVLVDTPVEHGDRLATFYEALARLERGRREEPLRIGFHGDSNLTQDHLTGELRRRLQARYGDAGHGFLVGARAWGWYRHQDVRQDNDGWWRVFAISAPRTPDLGYGLSGIAATCRSPGGRTWFATSAEDAPIGRDVGKISVFYRKHPGGGSFKVLLDGEACDEVSTAAGAVRAGHRHYRMNDGPHRIDIETTTGGEVRLLGVAFERERPGIIVDSFGVGGAYFQALTLDDHELSRQMAVERRHGLLVYWLGANPHHASDYPRDVGLVVAERRKAISDLPVLVISPPDAASAGKDSPSNPVSHRLTTQLRAAAEVNGCAFWPMRDAQGGEGAGGRFLKHGLATDRQHLSAEGSSLMARMLLHALWSDYRRYLRSHPRAGCEPAPAAPPARDAAAGP